MKIAQPFLLLLKFFFSVASAKHIILYWVVFLSRGESGARVSFLIVSEHFRILGEFLRFQIKRRFLTYFE